MDSFKRPLWICILLCSGSISAGILILLKIFQIDLKNSFIVGGICFFILLLTMTVLEGFASKLFALSSGIVVPVFAIVYGFPSLFSLYREGQRQKGNNILFALITVCQVSFITVLGSLVTAGILSSTKFFLTVDRFKGIKFIMTLPILLVIILYFYSLTEGNKSSGFFKKCKTFLLHPVRLWEVIIVFIIATGGIFYLIRTGNTSVVPVSDFERNLRAFLDNFLIVRPRFKDFLLGQPALFLTVYLWRRGNLRYLWLFLAFATLGQANIVDTFAHLHTPLLVSLLRVFHGLWIGCIVGFVAVGLYNIFILFEKHFKLRGHG
ncbi:MAG: hypothetical protein BWY64_02814 [bacterium ADurb.Bin363]|nr:MAG: hypothetical protein BWY64_02814 [bacterium ADurb.Bin363]